ncbi:hypothetical protein PAMC26577_24570 [Caballeronia sordidicola]|uniref:Uncharacterized protein n=1 Tax=Caballeronia sordidicola TaxID=196367 RepID=A0A242MIH0_CABSO|nr:hypothetical protein PAMC26577_24570 [Caballeronia sordidicola]
MHDNDRDQRKDYNYNDYSQQTRVLAWLRGFNTLFGWRHKDLGNISKILRTD